MKSIENYNYFTATFLQYIFPWSEQFFYTETQMGLSPKTNSTNNTQWVTWTLTAGMVASTELLGLAPWHNPFKSSGNGPGSKEYTKKHLFKKNLSKFCRNGKPLWYKNTFFLLFPPCSGRGRRLQAKWLQPRTWTLLQDKERRPPQKTDGGVGLSPEHS